MIGIQNISYRWPNRYSFRYGIDSLGIIRSCLFHFPNNCIYDLFNLASIFSRWEHEEVNWSKRWEKIVWSCLYKSNQQPTFTLGKRLIQAQSKYVCSTTITTTTFSKKPSPPSTHLAVGKCQRQNSMCICYYGLLGRLQPTLGNVRYYYVWFVIYATQYGNVRL